MAGGSQVSKLRFPSLILSGAMKVTGAPAIGHLIMHGKYINVKLAGLIRHESECFETSWMTIFVQLLSKWSRHCESSDPSQVEFLIWHVF